MFNFVPSFTIGIMIDAEQINAELAPLGYLYYATPDGGHSIEGLYQPEHSVFIKDERTVRHYVLAIQQSDEWELYFSMGAVDVDPTTGIVYPYDESEPYDANVVADTFRGNPNYSPKNAGEASFISMKSVERPAYGGNWYKVAPTRFAIPKEK